MTSSSNDMEPTNRLSGLPSDETLRQQARDLVLSDRDDEHVVLACSYLLDTCTQDPALDLPIMEALRRVLRRGLTFSDDPHQFLMTSRMMAQLCFKYQNYREANNWLLFLRDLSPAEQSSVPAWALLYSAKLTYISDRESALQTLLHPVRFFRYVAGALDVLGSTDDRQCHGVVAEFLDTALQQTQEDPSRSVCLAEVFGQLDELNRRYEGAFERETRNSIIKFLTSGGLERAADGLIASSAAPQLSTFLHWVSGEIQSCLEEPAEPIAVDYGSSAAASVSHKPRILILAGSNVVKVNDIYKAARQCSVEKDQLELHTDYVKNKHFQLETLRGNSRFDGILIGPEAHKVVDLGDYSSVIQKLECEDGFPPFMEIRRKSGRLQVSSTGFKDAMTSLLAKISANYPSSASSTGSPAK